VPDNWREIPDNNSVWFAPEGAYGQARGQAVYTHGINLSVTRTQYGDLQSATDEIVNSMLRNSPNMRQRGGYQRSSSAGRYWLSTNFSNINEATGRSENVALFTTQLRNGDLFFIFTVAPQSDSGAFQNAFANILRSIQIND